MAKRGRPALDRGATLKSFVDELKTKYGTGPYNRVQLATIGDTNQLGLKLFSSKKQGYGNLTRVSHGLYQIPTNWTTDPPWNPVTTTEAQ